MTVVSLKAENNRRDGALKAEFSDGSSLLFTPGYLPDGERDPALWENRGELSSGEEEAFRFAAECYQAEQIALRLVARAEQNSLGLTAKLERRGYGAAVAKAVVSCFLDRNLLNDGRYAELWIRFRLTSGKVSPRWLLVSLGKKGIDRGSSLKALREVLDPETEYALLLRYLEKTGLGRSGVSKGKREISLKAHLKNEGFSSDILDRFFIN